MGGSAVTVHDNLNYHSVFDLDSMTRLASLLVRPLRNAAAAAAAAAAPPSRAYRAVVAPRAGPASVLRLEQRPPLPPPARGQLAIDVEVAGVNPVDTYQRSGTYMRGSQPAFPFVPGSDCAGVVAAVGAGLEGRFAPGDLVYTMRTLTGAYAERALAEARHAWQLPDGTSFRQGAALGIPYHTAHRALFLAARAQVIAAAARGAERGAVLVSGATGGVGVAAVQMAAALGLTVFGSVGSPEGAAALAPWCQRTLPHGATEELLALTGGRGVDVIVENAAHRNLGADLRALAPGGVVVVVGSRGATSVDARDLMVREASVASVMLWLATDEQLAVSAAFIERGLRDGALRPLVGRAYGLEQAAAAQEEVIERREVRAGKIVLDVRPQGA